MTDEVSLDDWQLLRRFTEHNSQEAFAALTARYLNLVYSVCRRELDDAEAAEDVTQAVFLILARKAPTLRRGVVLSGWLFQTARFAVRNARLQAQRRTAYEQKAAEIMQQQSEEREDGAWSEIEPLLNRSLAALREGERDCVLLRFFQGLSFAEAGAALGLSEEAARKRVTRALEKMRKFLGKGGVIIPGVALAALLSAHAAKAAPATCSASIATTTAGVLAGHLPLSLTGSHVYQLSEGTLKAMKIAQLKVAIGLAATLVIGFSTYAVAKVTAPAAVTVRQIAPTVTAPKPGHVLVQAPAKTITSAQIAARCRAAYTALESYRGTSTVTSRSMPVAGGTTSEYHTSVNIEFVRPGRIHAEGTDVFGHPFAFVSDGVGTAYQANKDVWKTLPNIALAMGAVTGSAQNAATTVPALLLGTNWGNPFTPGFDPEVREDAVDGHPCYVLTSSLVTDTLALTGSFWIDEKTFLLRRHVLDAQTAATSFVIAGSKHDMPATKSREDQRFTNERLNEAIPDSAFTLPPS